MGYLFLVGSTVLLSMVVQQLAGILVFLQEEMNVLLPLHHLQPATSILGFLRNLYAVLHSGYISLHSHQQCSNIPFPSHSVQHLSVVDVLS